MKVLVCYHRYPRLEFEPVAEERDVTDLTRIGCPVGTYVFEVERRRWWHKIHPVHPTLKINLPYEPVRQENVPKIWRTYALLLVT